MRDKTRLIAESGICVALSVVLLYITAFIPTMTLAAAAVAGLFNAIIVIRHGAANGALPFIAASLIAVWVSPEKSATIAYILFFGYYPILKCLIEGLRRLVVEWILKLVLFNAALTAIYLFFSFVLINNLPQIQGFAYLVYTGGNVAFIVYDLGFSKLISFYGARIISKKL